MIILPRGKAVKEKISLKNFDVLDCLKKLQTGHFTGYLRFDSPEGTGIILFNRGKMIGIFFQGERENLIALRALSSIFENIRSGRSLLHIYSVSTRLLMHLFEILHGNIIYRGQELLLMAVTFLIAHITKEELLGMMENPDLAFDPEIQQRMAKLILEKPFLGALVLRLPMVAANPDWCMSTFRKTR